MLRPGMPQGAVSWESSTGEEENRDSAAKRNKPALALAASVAPAATSATEFLHFFPKGIKR